MKIKIEEISGGFSIKFPFEMKNQFREDFPSAKWNAMYKRWEVGPRSGKRLEQWAATVSGSGLIEELKARDEQDLAASELEELRRELCRVQSNISAERQRKASAEESKALMQKTMVLIKQQQKALAEQKVIADAASAEAKKEMDEVRKTLEMYVDLKAIYKVRDRMIACIDKVGRDSKYEWSNAQDVVLKEREKLLAAGLVSIGINDLAFANFNRIDRDDPRKVTLEKILTLRPRQKDAEN